MSKESLHWVCARRCRIDSLTWILTEGAAGACAFGTGMAATVTVMSAFLKAGDHWCACAPPWLRPCDLEHHQVLRWSQYFGWWCSSIGDKGARRPNPFRAEYAWEYHVATGGILSNANHKDYGLAHSGTVCKRDQDCDDAGGAPYGGYCGAPYGGIVRYPGLPSFPQKELADKYHRDGVHGSMMNFEVKGGTESGRKMMNSINRPWSL